MIKSLLSRFTKTYLVSYSYDRSLNTLYVYNLEMEVELFGFVVKRIREQVDFYFYQNQLDEYKVRWDRHIKERANLGMSKL